MPSQHGIIASNDPFVIVNGEGGVFQVWQPSFYRPVPDGVSDL